MNLHKKASKPPMPWEYAPLGRREFLAWLEPNLSAADMERVAFAYTCSKYAHRGQTRDGGKVRYFEHPKSVACILIHELSITKWQPIVTALLHDVLEDSFLLTSNRIRINFGPAVLRSLRLLTKDPKEGYHARLVAHGTVWDWIVKLCDRLHNMRTLGACTPEKRRQQIIETREVYILLAKKLITRLSAQHKWWGKSLLAGLHEQCKHVEQKLRTEKTLADM